ncbi:type IV secretion protein [Parashewanella curva]|uniref:Type IV secretion protein n=1 Tax=Parashewanella curva TaxID=2338552 RepID=A0A3L8PXY3_9GAMM|nr:TrbC/VirB2 family protein [Parashewanella curva]RLV59493.1 type IV secretion protein [Parashewanella curva]
MKVNSLNTTATNSISSSRLRALVAHLFLFSILLLVPELAFADPISEGVDWVMQLLTNGIARSAAIIGIAILGYLAWFGRITGETCGKYIAGIVLVFGGSTIVDLIISAVK